MDFVSALLWRPLREKHLFNDWNGMAEERPASVGAEMMTKGVAVSPGIRVMTVQWGGVTRRPAQKHPGDPAALRITCVAWDTAADLNAQDDEAG